MIPLSISEKLLQLAGGAQLPASSMKHAIVEDMVKDGIISVRITGRTKRTLYITDVAALDNWLYNRHSVNSLTGYINTLKTGEPLRADMVQAGSDSKTRRIRTYKGFLINSYMPVQCTLNGQEFTVHPVAGTFQFIYDFENFEPPPDATVVGIENMENFRFVERQVKFFSDIKPLFVCRYPQEQSKDLIKWLKSVPNQYLHFGDFDFAGINIYLGEFKAHLTDRASFFVPPGIENFLSRYGNPGLYDRQQLGQWEITEPDLRLLVALLHQYKKGLEQEALLIL